MSLDNLTMHVIMAFALWRLCRLLVKERGIFGVLERFRNLWGSVEYDEYSNPSYPNEIAHILSCIWCLSVWVCVPAGMLIEYGQWIDGLVLGLGYSGMVVSIDTILTRL